MGWVFTWFSMNISGKVDPLPLVSTAKHGWKPFSHSNALAKVAERRRENAPPTLEQLGIGVLS